MKKPAPAAAAFVALAFVGNLRAALNINTSAVKRSVVFLYGQARDGASHPRQPEATGFLVGVPLRTNPARTYVILITARHVFDPRWAGCGRADPNVMFMRLNRRGYNPRRDKIGVGYVPIHLRSGGKALFRVSDHADADVAALLLNPAEIDNKGLAVSPINISTFGTSKEVRGVSIGDSIVSAGLLPAYPGVVRNYPIFKFGEVSDIPSEDVSVRCSKSGALRSLKVWLIAANLVPGNSGSPIFYVPAGGGGIVIGSQNARPFLLGLQSLSFLGAGVAGMTPVSYIYETILDMDLPNANVPADESSPPRGSR